MRAIMVMYDSLNRSYLQPYGAEESDTPNFSRLARHAVCFTRNYANSLPCMPARRELHTGRYNFLHRSWGPLEPFDDSMPELLKQSGVYTQATTGITGRMAAVHTTTATVRGKCPADRRVIQGRVL